MTQNKTRKYWHQNQINTLVFIVEGYRTPINWTSVARQLNNQLPDSMRNGKQCRQRWNWEVSKKIQKMQWTDQQTKLFFTLYAQFKDSKNKWKQIAAALSNEIEIQQNQNQIKNFFYCTVRKALRKINKLVRIPCEPSRIRNLKPYSLSELCCNQRDSENYMNIFEMILSDKENSVQFNIDILEEILEKVIQLDQEYTVEKSENGSPQKSTKPRRLSSDTINSQLALTRNKIISEVATTLSNNDYRLKQSLNTEQFINKRQNQEQHMFFPSVFEVSEVQSVHIDSKVNDSIQIFFTF